jgi:hypothetical protein
MAGLFAMLKAEEDLTKRGMRGINVSDKVERRTIVHTIEE